jgi:hypothetical protein
MQHKKNVKLLLASFAFCKKIENCDQSTIKLQGTMNYERKRILTHKNTSRSRRHNENSWSALARPRVRQSRGGAGAEPIEDF